MRALLDVYVIIALLDRGHVMYPSACTWLWPWPMAAGW